MLACELRQSEIKQIKMTSIMISSKAGEQIEAQLGTYVSESERE